jgi:hypothetical protein
MGMEMQKSMVLQKKYDKSSIEKTVCFNLDDHVKFIIPLHLNDKEIL